MKLPDHVDHIRTLINKAFDNQFSRLGLGPGKMLEIEKIPKESHSKREKLDVLITSHTGEFGNYKEARAKALDELTFTLFNRLAAVKVMESLHLFPPIVTKQPEHGDRSFGHKIWLEENPEMRSEELEGLRQYFKDEFNKMGETIPLYHKSYPYALLPYVIDLNEIITAFNIVELDPQIAPDIWRSDDILGWLYESYNNSKKAAHKASKAKTEYHKVSLQSQVYTPRWVVEFLVSNSLGKLYLEMYPDSEIKNRFKIANAPETRTREIKPLHEIKMIDPASGSGNFLLYGFEFFYQLYEDQIDNYGADYDEDNIPNLIIENNLHGIDLDDRAIQLAQLGLWIKAKQKKRSINKLNFNIVSSDFYLPDFVFVEPIFKAGTTDAKQLSVIEDIWGDLQQAHKFGSLVKIDEKLSLKLHGLLDQAETTLFGEQELEGYERFKASFLRNLETAISRYATQQGSSFLTDKTKDAITFLKLLTTKYDVATANPPYTDSSDFGTELKEFIETNYKKPYKFHSNLYAAFIKRCYEITNEEGKIGLIHPHTFMYIKTFEDVRKFIINKAHIDVMVDFGLDRVNLFGTGILVEATFYVLNKNHSNELGLYFNLTNNLQEKFKKEKFLGALSDHIKGFKNNRVYELEQSKLKIIKTWPLIYWISDDFRENFKKNMLGEVNKVCTGLSTANNIRFLRFWWEIIDSKWIPYVKGGPYNKWYGNIWLTVNWEENGKQIKNYGAIGTAVRNEKYYFNKGITNSLISVKGISARIIPEGHIFDITAPSIFVDNNITSIEYTIGLLNSKFSQYVANCLNPTAALTWGDIAKFPFVEKKNTHTERVILLVDENIKIKKKLITYSLIESSFEVSPLQFETGNNLRLSIENYFVYENNMLTHVLINDAILNKMFFDIYELTNIDKALILGKEGESIGSFPVIEAAKQAYLENEIKDFPLDNIREFIEKLPLKEFKTEEQEKLVSEFPNLYQSNNDLEEFCIRNQLNPINVWYWFRESNIIPKQRMNDLAMEFLADMLRHILMEDEDGIIPLVPNAGEKVLLDRLEEKFMEKGFSRAQYSSFDSVLGKDLNEYINHNFFKEFSNHLNLYMYLPKTPFIWHLSSGPEGAFDCYIIIYKWSRDKLLRIRSVYIENRERSLVNRQSDLSRDDSAKAQNEKEKIYKQLKELEVFKKKIDELLQEGYNPILDDGVGKNIAPLQAKGMLPYEVLNPGQLDKYLNADW